MLSYLWTFNKFGKSNWGIKNLEFMLVLANDLQEPLVFDILLSPNPFATALSSLSFVEAMDFIDDHIVRNGFISMQQKLKLIYSQEMAPYSFIGALLHFSLFSSEDSIAESSADKDESALIEKRGDASHVVSEFDRQVDECENDLEIEELVDLYNSLTQRDVAMIVKSPEIIDRMHKVDEEIGRTKIPAGFKAKIRGMVQFILQYKPQ